LLRSGGAIIVFKIALDYSDLLEIYSIGSLFSGGVKLFYLFVIDPNIPAP
jgi:hypothetical protein